MPFRSPVSSEEEPQQGIGATIDAWRERGDHRFDPVRFRLIEVLARRADAYSGDARRILDDKVARLLAAYGEDLGKARCEEAAPAPRSTGTEGQAYRGAFAELIEHIAQHAVMPGEGPATRGAVSGLASAPELKTLKYFRSTWSKLSADRRLTQSLAKVPDNAGPLNSHHLVYRSLTLMRDLSPEYLNRFMSYVDGLLWIDQVNSASASAAANTPRGESPKKTTRSKSN
jgi:hypothetical protein